MNVRQISKGHYQISTGIAKEELSQLASDASVKDIQFVSALSDKEIELLETEVFSKRPDISLRVYGFYSQACDLSFLEGIPSLRRLSADCLMRATGIEVVTKIKNLELLGVGIYQLDNFDFLRDINPDLTSLYLHQTISKKPKIDCIERFKNLKTLYLEGQQKGIESISELRKLQKIILRSISTANLDFLREMQDLWSVDIKLGGIKNFEALTTLPNMKYLELWMVRNLSDLSFISKLPTLQNLFLQSLRQVEKLPDFSENRSLKRIYLENLKGLKDLSTLQTAPALKEFIYTMAGNQEVENVLPVLRNSNVESVWCGFGTKKNKAFEELMKQYGKSEYKFHPFEYS